MSYIEIHNLETNRPVTDLPTSAIYESTFNSTSLNSLTSFLASDFNVTDFVYKNFNITNSGSGKTSYITEEIQNGMLFNVRYGIGYFYFLDINDNDITEPVEANVYTETFPENVQYWDYLTTFWDYLT
jgi:hypothetical protein